MCFNSKEYFRILGLRAVLLHLWCGQQSHPAQSCGADRRGAEGVRAVHHQTVGDQVGSQPLHPQESREGHHGSFQELSQGSRKNEF